jgi:hypothetical protein
MWCGSLVQRWAVSRTSNNNGSESVVFRRAKIYHLFSRMSLHFFLFHNFSLNLLSAFFRAERVRGSLQYDMSRCPLSASSALSSNKDNFSWSTSFYDRLKIVQLKLSAECTLAISQNLG